MHSGGGARTLDRMICRILITMCLVLALASRSSAGGEDDHLFEVAVGAKTGFIDRTGRLVLTADCLHAWGYSEGLFVASDGKRLGFKDRTGKTVIPLRFAWVSPFSGGLAQVGIEHGSRGETRTGYVDRRGRVVIPAIYDFAHDFTDDRALVYRRDDRLAFIDRRGRVAIRLDDYDFAGTFSEGLVWVMTKDRRFGYLDREGRVVIPVRLGSASEFSEGLAAARPRRDAELPFDVPIADCGYIDHSGRFVIPPRFSGGSKFSEGLALVETGAMQVRSLNRSGREIARGRLAFVDRAGKTVIDLPEETVLARDFHEGRAYVELTDGRKGFIDTRGRRVVELGGNVASANDFEHGLVKVHFEDRRVGYVDRAGAYVWKPE